MVTNVTIRSESDMDLWQKSGYEKSNVQAGLFKLYPFDIIKFNFTTMRFHCHKPSTGRVLHLMTSDTENGKYAIDWFLGKNTIAYFPFSVSLVIRCKVCN